MGDIFGLEVINLELCLLSNQFYDSGIDKR